MLYISSLKRLEKIKTEEPLEGDEVKTVDLSEMSPLEGDEVKSEPKEVIAKRVKLNPPRKTETGLKILTPNKLLTRFPVLLAQI